MRQRRPRSPEKLAQVDLRAINVVMLRERLVTKAEQTENGQRPPRDEELVPLREQADLLFAKGKHRRDSRVGRRALVRQATRSVSPFDLPDPVADPKINLQMIVRR